MKRALLLIPIFVLSTAAATVPDPSKDDLLEVRRLQVSVLQTDRQIVQLTAQEKQQEAALNDAIDKTFNDAGVDQKTYNLNIDTQKFMSKGPEKSF